MTMDLKAKMNKDLGEKHYKNIADELNKFAEEEYIRFTNQFNTDFSKDIIIQDKILGLNIENIHSDITFNYRKIVLKLWFGSYGGGFSYIVNGVTCMSGLEPEDIKEVILLSKKPFKMKSQKISYTYHE